MDIRGLMRLLLKYVIVVVSLVCLGGVSAADEKSDKLVIVDDEVITVKQLKAYMQNNPSVDVKDAIDALIIESILYQQAKRLGYDKLDEVKEKISQFDRRTLVSHLVADKITKEIKVTEKEARELYEKNWMDSRYPRWVEVNVLNIQYKNESFEKMAVKYATNIRDKIDYKKFSDDYKSALDNLEKDFPPPDGITVKSQHYKKLFLLSFRKYKIMLEKVANSLKEGQTSKPIKTPNRFLYVLISVTREYPREEIPFKKVGNELMTSASDILYKEKIRSYIKEIKDSYNIEIYKQSMK